MSLRACVLVALTLFVGSEGVTLHCSYRNGGWAVIGTAYGCENVKVNRVGDRHVVTEVNENHPTDLSNYDVLGFTIFRDKTLEFFPRNLGAHFPNLTAIEVSHSSIDEIIREDLEDLPKLKILYLYGNHFTVIDSDLFAGNPALTWVSFSHNPISSVGVGAFEKLKELKELRFFQTKCIEEEYSEGRAVDIPHMINKIAKYCQNQMESVVEELKKLNSQLEARLAKLESLLPKS